MLKGMRKKRDGQILLIVALWFIVLMGMCALAVDAGRLYLAEMQLQLSVDAASLAGASQLSGVQGSLDEDKAKAVVAAKAVAAANRVAGDSLILTDEDIVFGRYDAENGEFIPESQAQIVDSVRVRGRRTDDSPNGPIPTFLASIFGVDEISFSHISGVASKPRRYIAFVIDRSGSMCFDTEDIQERYQPAWDDQERTYKMQKSPSGWYALPQTMEVRRGWWWSRRRAMFYALDDDTGRVRTDFLSDSIKDTLDQGKYWYFQNPEGDNNPSWLKAPSDVTIYSRYQTSRWYADAYYDSPAYCDYAITDSPVQPVGSTRDAASAFLDLLRVDDDLASLVTYSSAATVDARLSSDFEAVKTALGGVSPVGATAEPEAMEAALDELLFSDRAEGFGQRIMLLMTDGNANQMNGVYYGSGGPYSYEFMGKTVTTGIHPDVGAAMEFQTRRAISNSVRIYTVSFGEGADREVHQEIAKATNGAYYYSEDHEELVPIFIDIFRRLPPVITQ